MKVKPPVMSCYLVAPSQNTLADLGDPAYDPKLKEYETVGIVLSELQRLNLGPRSGTIQAVELTPPNKRPERGLRHPDELRAALERLPAAVRHRLQPSLERLERSDYRKDFASFRNAIEDLRHALWVLSYDQPRAGAKYEKVFRLALQRYYLKPIDREARSPRAPELFGSALGGFLPGAVALSNQFVFNQLYLDGRRLRWNESVFARVTDFEQVLASDVGLLARLFPWSAVSDACAPVIRFDAPEWRLRGSQYNGLILLNGKERDEAVLTNELAHWLLNRHFDMWSFRGTLRGRNLPPIEVHEFFSDAVSLLFRPKETITRIRQLGETRSYPEQYRFTVEFMMEKLGLQIGVPAPAGYQQPPDTEIVEAYLKLAEAMSLMMTKQWGMAKERETAK
jgi:hypothetical protein